MALPIVTKVTVRIAIDFLTLGSERAQVATISIVAKRAEVHELQIYHFKIVTALQVVTILKVDDFRVSNPVVTPVEIPVHDSPEIPMVASQQATTLVEQVSEEMALGFIVEALGLGKHDLQPLLEPV